MNNENEGGERGNLILESWTSVLLHAGAHYKTLDQAQGSVRPGSPSPDLQRASPVGKNHAVFLFLLECIILL